MHWDALACKASRWNHIGDFCLSTSHGGLVQGVAPACVAPWWVSLQTDSIVCRSHLGSITFASLSLSGIYWKVIWHGSKYRCKRIPKSTVGELGETLCAKGWWFCLLLVEVLGKGGRLGRAGRGSGWVDMDWKRSKPGGWSAMRKY